jgi:hypothetical protein
MFPMNIWRRISWSKYAYLERREVAETIDLVKLAFHQ